jgi:hypothetical protein
MDSAIAHPTDRIERIESVTGPPSAIVEVDMERTERDVPSMRQLCHKKVLASVWNCTLRFPGAGFLTRRFTMKE